MKAEPQVGDLITVILNRFGGDHPRPQVQCTARLKRVKHGVYFVKLVGEIPPSYELGEKFLLSRAAIVEVKS